jgi:hypothetical protein
MMIGVFVYSLSINAVSFMLDKLSKKNERFYEKLETLENIKNRL